MWGHVLHWDGATWNEVAWDLPPPFGTVYYRDVWGSAADDVWRGGDSGLLEHFDGTTWTPVDYGARHGLRGLTGWPGGEALAVGEGGTIIRHRP
jgi:hypothetical protein